MLARSKRSIVYWLFFLSFTALACHAQYSGNVQGVVSDPSGAAVATASVQLHNVDTGIEQSAITSGSGNYRFSSLPPGNYVLSAEVTGFRRTEAHFTLSTSETKGINLVLSLAAAQQTIKVEVTPLAVDTDDSRLEATLSADTVRDLPSRINVSGEPGSGLGSLVFS